MKKPVSFEDIRIYFSVNPWIRLLLPFSGGIAMALLIGPEKDFYYEEMYGLLFFLLLAYLATLYDKNGLGLKKWIPGLIGLLFLFCAGFQLARAGMSLHLARHYSKHNWQLLYIQVNSVPEDRGKRIRFEARVLLGLRPPGLPLPDSPSPARPAALPPAPGDERLPGHRLLPDSGPAPRWEKTRGRLLVYLPAGKQRRVVYGDRLLVAPAFREVAPPRNPAEFDYRSYLAGKDIYHQSFLSAEQWRFTGQRGGNPLTGWAAGLRRRCVGLFDQAFERPGDAAMLSAFVLGYRSGLDPETEAAFADTGTIHILSVSGLHVAILYWLVCLVLKPLSRFRGGRVMQLLLGTGAIVLYAFVTGLSPPVCRAAWMIVFCQLADFLGREHQTGNALAITAFLLLAANPLVLADVGFQLSFLAAAGLAGCAPLLPKRAEGQPAGNERLQEKGDRREKGNRREKGDRFARVPARLGRGLLRQIRSMTVVSLAAQLTTFPLAMYYFHQFPVYFLPANLLLIPLASFILYGGILLLPLAAAGLPVTLLTGTLSMTIDAMGGLMKFFSGLPGAVLDGIWIHPAECAGMYLLIACLLAFLLSQKGSWLCTTLGVLAGLMTVSTIEDYLQARQRRLILFHTRKNTVIGFLAGRKAVLFHEKLPGATGATGAERNTPYGYSVQPFLQRSGIGQVQHKRLGKDFRSGFLIKRGPWLQFFGLRLLVADQMQNPSAQVRDPSSRYTQGRCDLLLVTENTYLQTEELRQAFRIKMLVTGAGISTALARFLEEDCREHGTSFYSVERSGAFWLDLRAN